MFRKNLLIAYRSLKKHKFSSLINVLGLAIGTGVCLAILQYIHFELSYDNFHANAENKYRLTLTMYQNGEVTAKQAKTSYAIGVSAKSDIPEIENFVRIHPQYFGAIVTNPEQNNPFLEENVLFVDSTFLDVFNFSLRQGDPLSALDDKYSIVITEKVATKYFGPHADPVGKILKVDGWVNADYVVTGVLQPLPGNSHFNFDFLISMKSLLEGDDYGGGKGRWGRTNFFTYLTINKESDVKSVEKKLDKLVYDNFGKTLDHNNIKWEFKLQPIMDVHLYSDDLEDQQTNSGSILNLKALAIIAALILIIAWFNFINLSIASSMKRAKDVGVRKALGAGNQQLRNLFLIESLLINLVSAVFSLLVAIEVLAILNSIVKGNFSFLLFSHVEFWIAFITFILISSLISGFYPAFVLSSFKSVNLQVKFAKRDFGFGLRRGLLTFQFLISTLLISGTFMIYQQITFMKSQNLGVDMEEILVVRGPEQITDEQNLASNLASFKSEASRHSSILTATSSGTVPGKGHNAVVGMRKLGDDPDKNQPGGISFVDHRFFETYDFAFIAGHPFDVRMKSNGDVIINEEAVRIFELGTPEDAIDKKLLVGKDTVRILAVLKNFHWHSLKDEHMPILFVGSETAKRYISFKLDLSDIAGSLAYIRSNYSEMFPGNPFDYFFLDNEFNEQYQAELQFGEIFLIFSALAIFLSCLGLFAFVSFSGAQRTKEIGIRKVLGAEVSMLMMLLSKEYVALLVVSNLVAVPFFIYGAGVWLSNFAFRINLGPELFMIPVITLFIISGLTVGYQIYKIARANPVDSLRLE